MITTIVDNKISGNYWVHLILIFSMLTLAADIKTSRFDMLDFEVYYKTAQRILLQQELYNIKSDGHYVFKYSPVAGIFFIPLSLPSFRYAQCIYWVLLTALLIIGIRMFMELLSLSKHPEEAAKNKNYFVLFSLLIILTHFHRELHLGQVNMLLMVMYIFLTAAMLYNKNITFGILLSASIYIKPFGFIFFPYLILKREYKKAGYSALFLVLLGLLPFIFYPSVSEVKNLYVSWWTELMIEMQAKQDLLAEGNHTIFSVLARHTPIQHIIFNYTLQKIYQLTVLIAMALIMRNYIKSNSGKTSAIKEMALLVAFIPLLAFTSENAFIFIFPLALYLTSHFNEMRGLKKVMLVLGALLIGGNIYDIVGREVNHYLLSISVYTIGALMLLIVFMLLERKRKNEASAQATLKVQEELVAQE